MDQLTPHSVKQCTICFCIKQYVYIFDNLVSESSLGLGLCREPIVKTFSSLETKTKKPLETGLDCTREQRLLYIDHKTVINNIYTYYIIQLYSP